MEKKTFQLLIDSVYSSYESENSLQNVAYMHPMFYNGTFSKDNSFQPDKPEELMTKDEFMLKLNNESPEYRWTTALQVLYNYVQKKQLKDE